MRHFFKQLYLEQRFYLAIGIIVVLFILNYVTGYWFNTVRMLLLIILALAVIDVMLLFFNKKGIKGKRDIPERLSNGDHNPINIYLKNHYNFDIEVRIIDELPFQFQKRDLNFKKHLKPLADTSFFYELRPTTRGIYKFGHLNVFVKSPIGFVSRRYRLDEPKDVACYPSFIQLQKFDLLATSFRNDYGLKKVRRIGHTMEFEQIKDYTQGDDIRTINWKATAKKGHLMVNQFQDETAQAIYSVIDKGRVMKMPFNGMSLLDYAINASLVISNVILKKKDKAGIFTFSKHIENTILAENRPKQLHQILKALYHIETNFYESDFGRLYTQVNSMIKQRSLLFVYTNFETLDELERQIKYLQALAKRHVVVVVFFINTEMEQLIKSQPKTIKEIYHQTIATQLAYDKELIVKQLNKRGIYTILTKPNNLNVNIINKYLAIKARGVI